MPLASFYMYLYIQHIIVHLLHNAYDIKLLKIIHNYIALDGRIDYIKYIYLCIYLRAYIASCVMVQNACMRISVKLSRIIRSKYKPNFLIARYIDETHIEHIQWQFNQTFPSVRYETRSLNRWAQLDGIEVGKQ